MQKDIFVSESSIGSHIPAMEEMNTILISFTFRPTYTFLSQKIADDLTNQVKIAVTNKNSIRIENETNESVLKQFISCGEDIVLLILKKMEEYHSRYIYLGQDYDASGELMASLLQYHLVSSGISRDRIFRVPLLDIGYDYLNIGFSDFYKEEQLRKILEFDIEEQIMMLKNPRTLIGFRKMFALAHLYLKQKNKNYRVKKLNEGTNTATVLTKMVLGERN